jgi:hypothetical protein
MHADDTSRAARNDNARASSRRLCLIVFRSIIMALPWPERQGCSSHVSFEFRNGMWLFFFAANKPS